MRSRTYGAIRRQIKRSHANDVPAGARPDWRKEWETRKAAFVESVWRRMMREPWTPLYAYYSKTDRIVWGELYAVSDCETAPAGAELITAERIPAGNRPTIAQWFERFAGTLAVLPD
jgi:hypothetical protein